MALFRFSQELEFIRFLNDTEVLRHGLIRGVIRRGGFGGAVEVATLPLPDADFERLSSLLSPYRGQALLDEDSQEVGTRGLEMGRYVETILAQLEDPAAVPRPERPGELLLLVEDNDHRFERTRDLILQFSDKPESSVMAGNSNGNPVFLFRLDGLASHYPLIRWESEKGYSLFVLLENNPRCYIKRGYRFPLKDLTAYHPGLGAVNLIGPDGWWWKTQQEIFYPLGDLSEVRFSGAHPSIQMAALPPEQLPKFKVELRLEKDESPSAEKFASDARESVEAMKARLLQLESTRRQLEAEIDRLRHQAQPSPLVYKFQGESCQALLKFLTHYPLREVRQFRYFASQPRGAEAIVHWVLPTESEQPQFLPAEVAHRARRYERHPGWYGRHRVEAYLPEGCRLIPDLEFSSARQLVGILGGEAETHLFILESGPAEEVISYAFPRKALISLAESIQTINATTLAPGLETLQVQLGEALEEGYRQAMETGRSQMELAGHELSEEFVRMTELFTREVEELRMELERYLIGGSPRPDCLEKIRALQAELSKGPMEDRSKRMAELLRQISERKG